MAPTHSLTTAPLKASGRGDLDGFEVRCSCGFRATTSLSEREARKLGFDHAAWAKQAGK